MAQDKVTEALEPGAKSTTKRRAKGNSLPAAQSALLAAMLLTLQNAHPLEE